MASRKRLTSYSSIGRVSNISSVESPRAKRAARLSLLTCGTEYFSSMAFSKAHIPGWARALAGSSARSKSQFMLFPKRIQEATQQAAWKVPLVGKSQPGRPFAIDRQVRRAEYPVPQAKNHGKVLPVTPV